MFARDTGGRTQGEVTETKTELGIQAGKAAALTVGEAMVAAGRFEIGFDRSRQESETLRVCVHCFLEGCPPHENVWAIIPSRQVGQTEIILPLWEDEPYSLVSWWDMLKFSADQFWEISRLLEKMAASKVEGQENLVPDTSNIGMKWLPAIQKMLLEVGLRLSAMHVDRLMNEIKNQKLKIIDFQKIGMPELHRRIADELRLQLFLHVPPERAARYDQIDAFGPDISKNFPSASFDIKEAGNCFASGRFTACVFHLMRVLEIGLVAFAKLFPAVPTNKENWQQIIEKIESEIRSMPSAAVKPADWKEKQEKYSQLANSFMFFKDAWRNYTAHARGKYTEDEADAIYRNVRSFMQGLATISLAE